jgi:hypothetical protein
MERGPVRAVRRLPRGGPLNVHASKDVECWLTEPSIEHQIEDRTAQIHFGSRWMTAALRRCNPRGD